MRGCERLNANKIGALGVDIGGVIIERQGDGDTSFFSENFLATPPVKCAFDTIRLLREKMFGDQIFLVSKCGVRIQEKTREWLQRYNFFEATGVPFDNVHFCLTRPEKAPICEKLRVSAFIDDREDVLSHLISVEQRILFRTKATHRHSYVQLATWPDIARFLLSR